MTRRRLCVFCGSNAGASPVYAECARDLAHALVDDGIGLVYGGGSVGLMGILADAMLERGGDVVGVIPRALWEREVGHTRLGDLRIVESMHERKAMMADLADGFIALPGGLGTLEEFFEVWTWAQLGIHRKPCGLLNVAGYFDALLAFLDHAVDERLLRDIHRAMLIVETDPRILLARFRAYEPPDVPKWLAAGET